MMTNQLTRIFFHSAKRHLPPQVQFWWVVLLCAAFLSSGFAVHAQQGDLDTIFGTNSTGIYQDDKPTLPLPASPVDRARYYGFSEVLADGKIVVAGNALGQTPGNSYFGDFVLRRLNANGTVDTSFGSGGDVQTTFYRYGAGVGQQSDTGIGAMKVQPSDGKIIVAGVCRGISSLDPNANLLGSDLCLIRYNANGTIDTTFGGNTIVAYGGNPNFPPTTYTMEAGKVLTFTGTYFDNPAITQGSGGTPVKIQIAPDGRIFVFGNSRDSIVGGNSNGGGRAKGFVAVYSPNGALQNLTSLIDTTGSTTAGWGETQIYDGDILSNGDFVAVGYHRTLVSSNPSVFSANRWRIFSSSGGGFLETNVNAGGSARSLTMLRSNKILVGGQTGGFSQFGTPTLVRYNGDLTVDTGFGTNGRIVFDGTGGNNGIDTFWIGTLRNQPDGKILGTTNNGNIARFNPNGSLDRSWAQIRLDVPDSLTNRGILGNFRFVTPFPIMSGSDGRINYGNITFRPNGRLITAGSVGEGSITGPSGRGVVTQIKSYFRNGGTFSDFNNDGSTELSVFRPSDASWQYRDSFDNTTLTSLSFGQNTDRLAPADYDGDGKTDLAVFRSGTWLIRQSTNSQTRVEGWGQGGDVPRPGDFNGDGQADLAVFRPANATWYVRYSNPLQPGNITDVTVPFGATGDFPLPGDFDGDGKTDYAYFRPSNAAFSWRRSTDSVTQTVTLGTSASVPVVGDYDGDGKTDPAVFNNGMWQILKSTDGMTMTVQLGAANDRPVPADYDNDGRTDLAVFKNGVWTITRSSTGQTASSSFSLASDVPLPSVYLPIASTLQLSAATYAVSEANGRADITLTRNGDIASPASINLRTSDGTASQRTDYTFTNLNVNFAAGEGSKIVTIPIINDAFPEPNETINLALSNSVGGAAGSQTNAVITILNDDSITPVVNPIDDARFFVQQTYFDFLSRFPDQAGEDYWTGQITNCGNDAACRYRRRYEVSNAFFFELEYQRTGAFVYRLYRAAYGNNLPANLRNTDAATSCAGLPPPTVLGAHLPNYTAFSADRALIDSGNLAPSLESLAADFASRAEFVARYPQTQTGPQFVDAVLATIQSATGANLTPQRDALLAEFNLGGRGRVMFRLADDNATSPVINTAFLNAEYNRAFVATQYFGYLRRDADVCGLNFWFGIVNRFPARDVTGQKAMVCAFSNSAEYQQRYSSVVTFNDQACPQPPAP